MQPSPTVLRSAAALFALGYASTAQAQTEWDPVCGCYIMCVGCSDQGNGGGNGGGDYVYTPSFDQFAADFQAYDTALRRLESATNLATYYASLPAPGNETELNSRLDEVFGSLWPQFSSAALESHQLRIQFDFLAERNRQLREEETYLRNRIAELSYDIPTHQQHIASAEGALMRAREFEAEVREIALAQINDQTSERQATAALLAFAPDTIYTPRSLDYQPNDVLMRNHWAMPNTAIFVSDLAARAPEVPEPNSNVTMLISPPVPSAPVSEKIAMLHRMGDTMSYDTRNLPYYRNAVPEQRAIYGSLLTETTSLESEARALEIVFDPLSRQLPYLDEETAATQRNTADASARIIREVVVDLALDNLTGRLRGIVDEIAGSEGLDINVPANGTEAMLEFARRGGRMLLPVEGYQAQWDAFVETQGITQGLLENATSFITEAAHVAASSSPEQMEAVIDRVFATVNCTSLDYVRATGFSAIPEGEDRGILLDATQNYADRRCAQETGE